LKSRRFSSSATPGRVVAVGGEEAANTFFRTNLRPRQTRTADGAIATELRQQLCF
jgi:hypothetical protein